MLASRFLAHGTGFFLATYLLLPEVGSAQTRAGAARANSAPTARLAAHPTEAQVPAPRATPAAGRRLTRVIPLALLETFYPASGEYLTADEPARRLQAREQQIREELRRSQTHRVKAGIRESR